MQNGGKRKLTWFAETLNENLQVLGEASLFRFFSALCPFFFLFFLFSFSHVLSLSLVPFVFFSGFRSSSLCFCFLFSFPFSLFFSGFNSSISASFLSFFLCVSSCLCSSMSYLLSYSSLLSHPLSTVFSPFYSPCVFLFFCVCFVLGLMLSPVFFVLCSLWYSFVRSFILFLFCVAFLWILKPENAMRSPSKWMDS